MEYKQPSPSTVYAQTLETAQAERKKVQSAIARISTLRITLFIICLSGVCYFGFAQWIWTLSVVLGTSVPFLYLLKRHNRLFSRRDYLDVKIEVNRQELNALQLNFEAFEDGSESIDPGHRYSFDLDLFGPRSLFQCINRTGTPMGKSQLTSWLNQHLEDKKEIELRQQAVNELSAHFLFRQRFRILSLLYQGERADEEELKAWSRSSNYFGRHRWMKALPVVVALINLICLLLTLCHVMPFSVWGIVWAFFMTAAFCFTGRIGKEQAAFGKKQRILNTYVALLKLIEKEPFEAPLLVTVQQYIKQGHKQNPHQASEAIRQLSKLMDSLDQRNNIYLLAVLNGLFFWELHKMIRIEQWKERHAESMPQWLYAIGQADALCSLATFAYNHPDYTYPQIVAASGAPSEDRFVLEAEAMAHPLMDSSRCVRNDIRMEGSPSFIIITGANMAGKSTYLRTVGVNYLLACIGCPVAARSMTVCPHRLITSLRTSDSLTDNESYFFAELKRLKQIIDRLKSHEPLFIILDEILKGTNSIDKQKGSLALVKQFIGLRANGIIATHDLLLGSLIRHYPGHIRNFCFEADILNDELTFSYRMRSGVAQNMNACFLMKKMGIAVAEEELN